MTLTSLNLLTDSMENLDIPKYEMPDFTDPYKSIGFVWEITSIIFNAYIIYRAAQGWLIKPRITKQVVYASSLAIFWILINLIQFFIQHRILSILNAWTGYPLTLLVGLQHIELLRLFVSLSDFWTERKCKIFQLILVVIHFVITSPEYIWPLGLENNKGLRGLAALCVIPWIGILIICDNFCAIVSIRLMWNHLLSLRGLNSKKEDVPSGRYYKVVVWIAAHASLDIFSLIVFSVARIGPVGDREQMLLEYLTTPVVAYHVGCYPIVYCGVRDLKFHGKVKEYRANPVPLRKARSSGSKSPNGTPPDASVIPRSPKSLEDQLLEPLPFITSNSSPTRRRSLEVEKRVSMVTPRRLNSMRRNPIPYNHLKLESAGTINRGTSVISGFRDIVQHSRQHALPVVGVLGNESRPRSAATTPKQTTVIN